MAKKYFPPRNPIPIHPSTTFSPSQRKRPHLHQNDIVEESIMAKESSASSSRRKKSRLPQDPNTSEPVDLEEESVSSESDETGLEEETAPLTHSDHKENGNASYRQKDYLSAISHYTSAIDDSTSRNNKKIKGKSLGPTLASYYSNRAAAYTMLLNHEEALEDCQAALMIDPTFSKAQFRKAKIHLTLGMVEDALKEYSLAMRHDPNNATAIEEKNNATRVKKSVTIVEDFITKMNNPEVEVTSKYKIKREAQEALINVEIVLASCPLWKHAEVLKTEVLMRLERNEEALALTTKLLRLGMEQDGKLLFLRAKLLFRDGNLEGSLNHLRRILNGDPDNKPAFKMLKQLRNISKKKEDADKAYKAKDYDDAIDKYGECVLMCSENDIDDNPNYLAKLCFNRAAAQANLRNHDQVIADCTKAIKLDRTYLKAYTRRASSYVIVGTESACRNAVSDYEKAYSMASTEAQQREIAKKIKDAKIALKRSNQKDLYKILVVSKDASDSEIKKAYRKAALKYHPDRHATSTEQEKKQADEIFKDVNMAYEVLSDSTKRSRYDSGVDEKDIDNPNATPEGCGGGFGGMDQNDIFSMFMRQQQGGRQGGGGGGFHFG